MTTRTGHNRRVAEALRLIAEYRALLILGRLYNSDLRSHLEGLASSVSTLTNRELDILIRDMTSKTAIVVKGLKPAYSNGKLAQLLAKRPVPEGHFAYMRKWELTRLLPGLERSVKLLPEGALISLDPHGLLAPNAPGELLIMEADLYEDMCALFNRAWELGPVAVPPAGRPIIKEAIAARRATALAAFYFVEGYLNSLAFDHLVVHGDSLSGEDSDRLMEWDSRQQRERFVKFRDKLLHYPRIIIGAEHPPLQESNSSAIKYLLEVAKDFRDAIVHANPRPREETYPRDKETLFWAIGGLAKMIAYDGQDMASEWTRVVDSAISVVEEVEKTVHGDLKRLKWLKRRRPEGPFPPSAFD